MQKAPSVGEHSITSQAIQAYNGVKINYQTDQEKKDTIKYILVLLGLTEPADVPDKIELWVINDFIEKSYGEKYSCEDLRTAFRWGINGTIDMGRNRSLYGKRFSPEYISRFMNEYIPLRNDLIQRNERLLQESFSKEANQKLLSAPKADRIEECIEWLKVCTHHVLNDRRIPPAYNSPDCFDALEHLKLITLTEESIDDMSKKVIAAHKKELENMRYRGVDPIKINSFKNSLKDKNAFIGAVIKMFTDEYFQNLLKEPVPNPAKIERK